MAGLHCTASAEALPAPPTDLSALAHANFMLAIDACRSANLEKTGELV
jgi:hypothetical protein